LVVKEKIFWQWTTRVIQVFLSNVFWLSPIDFWFKIWRIEINFLLSKIILTKNVHNVVWAQYKSPQLKEKE